MSILALVAEGTAQKNRSGVVRDTNMWKVASKVADKIVYVSGVGVEQRFACLRMATGWGAKAKASKLVDGFHKAVVDGGEGDEEFPTVIGLGGSRGVPVLLRALQAIQVPVHAAVLFDAVYSFGTPWLMWLDKKLWPHEVPENIRQALHVVAEHEDTPGFSPTIYPDRRGLLQVKTPGDHTEVLRGPRAERIALAWLETLGAPARFGVPEDGWGKPTRRLDGLDYYFLPS